jgi:CHASE3 domain sensor protein
MRKAMPNWLSRFANRFFSKKLSRKKRGSRTIRQRLLAGFLLSSFICLVVAGFGIYSLWNAGQTSKGIEDRLESMPTISNAISTLSTMQTQVAQAALSNSSTASYKQVQETVKKYNTTVQAYLNSLKSEVTDEKWSTKINDAIKTYNSYYSLLNNVLDSGINGDNATANSLLRSANSSNSSSLQL